MRTYPRLAVPGEEVSEPRYVVEYKSQQWGAHRISVKTILLAIQLHYAIPSTHLSAYLLNNGEERVYIHRLSGVAATEAMTLQELFELRYGRGSWCDLKKRPIKGFP